MDGDQDTNRLGAYLRARRALITPEQAGIPPGLQRRVAGLRREEVALLAGISADYYLRLERGRDRNPSEQVLTALARVLQLDDVEHRYLVELAGPRRRARPSRRAETVPARLAHLLAAVDVPAFVEGRAFDVLAANPLAAALNPRLRPGENRLRSLLLDPGERGFHADWEAATAEFVGSFRRSIDGAVDDPRIVDLVGELSLASGRFRELWARHDVRRLRGGRTSVHHPLVGELHLHRDKLPVDEVTLVLYYADVGSGSAEKLQVLASLAGEAAERPAEASRTPTV
ncbi:helix-turn-helix domain-containing protein [Modestobacter italicus]|uniref:helix-turn-helix domain-containing protein n=1 Tax=Modestobacter italicus (strain DSM 44449 / CECT 9708 / BC 501) TaxID=2732864 RepID=UPI001C97AA37|nr:helix-turn-helix transcriptional regulator [Modestobacter italicus]